MLYILLSIFVKTRKIAIKVRSIILTENFHRNAVKKNIKAENLKIHPFRGCPIYNPPKFLFC